MSFKETRSCCSPNNNSYQSRSPSILALLDHTELQRGSEYADSNPYDSMGSVREIQLPERANSLRSLTHPSEIRKRTRFASRVSGSQMNFGGSSRGLVAPSTQHKRKAQDQPGVFDHLAALRKKQRCQLKRDSQEVPSSPQTGVPPEEDSLSLHSHMLKTAWKTKNSKLKSKTKKIQFASELVTKELEGSDPECQVVAASSPRKRHGAVVNRSWAIASFPKRKHGAVVDPSQEIRSRFVPSLGEDTTPQGAMSLAQVPLLSSPGSQLCLANAPPAASSSVEPTATAALISSVPCHLGGCTSTELYDYYPREE